MPYMIMIHLLLPQRTIWTMMRRDEIIVRRTTRMPGRIMVQLLPQKTLRTISR